MEPNSYQAQTQSNPESRTESQLNPVQVSTAPRGGNTDYDLQAVVEQSQIIHPDTAINSSVPSTVSEARNPSQNPTLSQTDEELKHITPKGVDSVSMSPSDSASSRHDSNLVDKIPDMTTCQLPLGKPPYVEMDAAVVRVAEHTATSGLEPGIVDTNMESELDRVKDSTISASDESSPFDSNATKTFLDSKPNSESTTCGDVANQYLSLGNIKQFEGSHSNEMKLHTNLGGNTNSKSYQNYDDRVSVDETCSVETISCDKSTSEVVKDQGSLTKEDNSSDNIPSTTETHHQELLDTPSIPEPEDHHIPPSTSFATGSIQNVSTTVDTQYQSLMNTSSTNGKECHLVSPSTESSTSPQQHPSPANTSAATAGLKDRQNLPANNTSKDLPQCGNSKETELVATDSFPQINQSENNLHTVINPGKSESFQLPPLPEINSTVSSTVSLRDIQQPFVSLVKLDDKLLSVSNLETLVKKASNSQPSPKSNKSKSRSKSSLAKKHSVKTVQKNNSLTSGYQQILDLCDQHFPPKISLIQDLINLSHNISQESGIKENFTNICNQLMSEILHLNLTLTNICRSAIDARSSVDGQETSQKELPSKESSSRESPHTQTFDSILSVWKQNMNQRQSTGKLSFEDAELSKTDERSEVFQSNGDSPAQISISDIERQWHARFPNKGSNSDITNSQKSKPRSRKSTERVYAEKDDNEDGDYVPSKSRKKQESLTGKDLGRSLRSRRKMSKTYNEEFYVDNSISDTEIPLDKSDGEYIPSDEEETSGKFECRDCDMIFKTQDLLIKHQSEKHNKQLYTCDICNKSFRFKIAFDCHIKNHAKGKTPRKKTSEYECQECGVKFLQKFRLAIHKRVHMENEFTCELCNKEFDQQKTLNKHLVETHSVQNQFDCQQCGRTFRSVTSFRFHMMNHKGILPFACNICDKKFTNISARNCHERTHSDVKSFSCDECDKEFRTCATLKRHKLLHGQEKNFQCDLCGQQFRQKSTLVSHRRTHTGEKPYVCDICGKAFTQSSILNMHKRVHTGYKPHKCTECESSFSCRASLRKHMTIHTGEKNFMCKVCGRRFARAQGLKYHEISHTGVKPYQCKECGKRFTCRKHVKRHQLLHSGEMPFSCSVCGKLFRQEQNMKVHMRIHSGDKPFQCTNCGRCFAYKQSLQQHNMRCVVSAIYLPLQQQANVSMNPSAH